MENGRSVYYREKIILANKVPINEEEILEYIIKGIFNVHLRNQVKLQQFKSTPELSTAELIAFESVNVTEEEKTFRTRIQMEE